MQQKRKKKKKRRKHVLGGKRILFFVLLVTMKRDVYEEGGNGAFRAFFSLVFMFRQFENFAVYTAN